MAHQLNLNTTALEELKAVAAALPVEKKVQESKTVTPTTADQTVSPDSGYDGLASVTVNAMPTGSVGTPSISVDSSTGVVTATAAVDAGYVDGTDKTGTMSLTTKAAATITPGTSNKTIAAGTYLTGMQTIAGDADLKAENIAEGVSIFGVTGTLPVSSLPEFTYSGSYDTVDEGNGNWKIRFLTGGTFIPKSTCLVDIFAVGGGGGGRNANSGSYGGHGGGGGFTAKASGNRLTENTEYVVTIGAGGAVASAGGSSSFSSLLTAAGAEAISGRGGHGGSGGGPGAPYYNNAAAIKGGNGGSDGGDGQVPSGTGSGYTSAYLIGAGQGTTTREFHETTGDLYAGGGGGGAGGTYTGGTGGAGGGGRGAGSGGPSQAGIEHTGGGGGGGQYGGSNAGSAGGSGIVIIRNAR